LVSVQALNVTHKKLSLYILRQALSAPEGCASPTDNRHINPLKTKGRLLYLKTQSVPRSKLFSSRL